MAVTRSSATTRTSTCFDGLSGRADFYATTTDALRHEGHVSLKVFLDLCHERNREPYRDYSGKFNARTNPQLHARAVEVATAKGISLNQFERAVGAKPAKSGKDHE